MAKRLVVIGFIVLIVAAVALPPVLGMVYEKRIRAEIEAAPQVAYMNLELVDYQRGLYTSQGTMRLALTDEYLEQIKTITGQGASAEDQAELDEFLGFFAGKIQFDFDVKHGPITFGPGVRFGLASVSSFFSPQDGALAEFQQSLDLPYLMRLDALVKFNGSSNFHATVPSMSGSVPDGRYNWSGASMRGNFDHRDRRLQAKGNSESFDIEAVDGRMSVKSARFDVDATMLTDYLALGKSRFDVGSIDFQASSESVTLRELAFYGDLGLNDSGDKLSGSFNYELAQTDVGDTSLEDLQVSMRLSEIDLEAAKDYMQLYQQGVLTPPEEMQQFFAEMASVAERILLGSPVFELAPVKFTLNGEPFLANVSIRFDGDALPSGVDLEALESNPALLLGAIQGEGQIQASEGVARMIAINFLQGQIAASIPEGTDVSVAELEAAANQQVDAMLAGLVAEGLIERVDGKLSTTVTYANGELVVNGTKIPL